MSTAEWMIEYREHLKEYEPERWELEKEKAAIRSRIWRRKQYLARLKELSCDPIALANFKKRSAIGRRHGWKSWLGRRKAGR